MARSLQRGRIRSMRTVEAEIRAPGNEGFPDVLTPDALDFLGRLHREVEPTRVERLASRAEVAERLRSGGTFHFLSGTADIRQKDWRVADVPRDLRVRKVEITGPTDRKMVIKATVLVEVLPLAFEMEETLYELRDHSAGLNAGRWDYMFSIIKKLGERKEFILPDRGQVAMTVPFMRAYTELLVKTCHKRSAFALGGMAAFIPNRRDPAVTETALAKVRDDKKREATDGFDGTWVAHPDLVETAMSEFDRALGKRPNQLDRQRPEVNVTAEQLLDVRIPGGTITDAGLRTNVSVGIQYIASWLRGTGAAAINNLMEDAATAEISRSQVWQWIHHGVSLAEGPRVTTELVRDVEREELAKIKSTVGDDFFAKGRYDEAREIFEAVALSGEFKEFLTIPAYEHID